MKINGWIDEHEMAAGYHYAILNYMEENPKERDAVADKYGDEGWHELWFWVHDGTAEYLRRILAFWKE